MSEYTEMVARYRTDEFMARSRAIKTLKDIDLTKLRSGVLEDAIQVLSEEYYEVVG